MNDAPVSRPHTFLDVYEDTQYTLDSSALLLRVNDLVLGSAPPATKDSAGALEDVGPDGIFTAADNNQLTQSLFLIEPDAQSPNLLSITTTRGGLVEFVDTDFSKPVSNN